MFRYASRKLPLNLPLRTPRLRSSNRFRLHSRFASTATFGHESKSTSTSARKQNELPKEADIVVIGGGALGCAVTYYLSKISSSKIVLLDKHDIASGTTWHSEALIWQLRPSDIDIQLLKRTMQLAESLPEESGIDVGLVKNGGLFIASRKERLDEYKRLHTIGKLYGVTSQVLTPPEVAALVPQVNTSDVYGALYSPTDGAVDPTAYCNALLKAAENSGNVNAIAGCAVTRLETIKNHYGRRVLTGVETDFGTIKTSAAVLCAGLWSPLVTQNLDVELNLALSSFYHTYAVTGEHDDFSKMPNIRDHDGSISTKVLGKSLCVAGYEPDPTWFTGDQVRESASSSKVLGNVNWRAFRTIMKNAIHRVPALKNVRINSTICGPEAFTPDHKPLLGDTNQLLGLFLCCGFNAGGIMYSAGCAHELAHWIVHGKPQLDMSPYDNRRFSPVATRNETWVKERSHEAYATNYAIIYRNDSPLAGRNLKKDVLHGALLSEGCVYQERFGWERPAWFSKYGDRVAVREYDFGGAYGYSKHSDYLYADLLKGENTFDFPLNFAIIKRECAAAKTAASVTNLSSRGKFFLVGRDAYRAADWLFTNVIPRQYGQVVQTLMLNKQAGIELDATVCVINNYFDPMSLSFDRSIVTRSEIGENREEEEELEPYYYYVTVDCASATKFSDLVNREIETRNLQCSLLDTTDIICSILLQGPKSLDVLRIDVPNLTHKVLVLGDSVDRFKCRILQFARAGEIAFELHVPSRDGRRLLNYLKRRGAMHGLIHAGHRALDSLSIENAIPQILSDLRNNDTPHEAGLSSLCKLNSHRDFLGKKALLKQDEANLPKRLIRLSLRKNLILHGLETVYRNGICVGSIRRADYGHSSAKSYGFGYVEKSLAKATLTDDFLASGHYQIERFGELSDADVSLVAAPAAWSAK